MKKTNTAKKSEVTSDLLSACEDALKLLENEDGIIEDPILRGAISKAKLVIRLKSNIILKEKPNLKIAPLRNPLGEYKSVMTQIKALEASKEALRQEIFGLMDAKASDSLIVGEYKAQKVTVEQYKVDTKKVSEILGDRYSEVTTYFNQIRLTVI